MSQSIPTAVTHLTDERIEDAPAAASHSSSGISCNSASSSNSVPSDSALPFISSLEPSVIVEDEPQVKCCFSCRRFLIESNFSGSQLKKKGKRVCKGCVSKKEKEEADARSESDKIAAVAAQQARDWSSSASASAVKSVPLSSSADDECKSTQSNSTAASSSSTPLRCITCDKRSAKLRSCSKCASLCCSASCLKQHRSSSESGKGNDQEASQCDVIRTMPPMSIAQEDLLSKEEVAILWPRLFDRIRQMPHAISARALHECSDSKTQKELLYCASVPVEALSFICTLYPPSIKFDWWSANSCGRTHANAMNQFARTFGNIMQVLDNVYQRCGIVEGVLEQRSRGEFSYQGEFSQTQISTRVPPALDESRLFHRLMRYWIYYMRLKDLKVCVIEIS